MKDNIRFFISIFLLFCSINFSFGQIKQVDNDFELKDQFYKKFKKEVQAYDKKDFDTLFFEFFQKQNDSKIILTKEEFYTYTIKIAIYSEKLGLLYKDQKEVADQTKHEWFDRTYSEYLKSKK